MQIETDQIDAGEYEIIIESFNTLSLAQSALKTDTIYLTIAKTLLTFSEELSLEYLSAIEPGQWTLPEI